VYAGKIAVQDDDVVGVDVDLGCGVYTVVGDIDSESLISEPFSDVVGQASDVFHNEHSHAGIPTSAG
jgi:hypothetical protein